MSDIDVVFIATHDATGRTAGTLRRTIAFGPGEPVPRVGECVIIGFDGAPTRWQVHDVAHIFEDDGHGVAIKLVAPDEA